MSKPASCLLPPVGGLCKAYNPKYFYNSTINECKEFIYGGCGGNDNKFDTKDSCMESCGDAGMFIFVALHCIYGNVFPL